MGSAFIQPNTDSDDKKKSNKSKETQLQRHRPVELNTFHNVINYFFDDKTIYINQNVLTIIFKFYYRCIVLCYQNESGYHHRTPIFLDVESDNTRLETIIIYSDGCIYHKHVSWDSIGNYDHDGKSWLDHTTTLMAPEPGLLLTGLRFDEDFTTLDGLVYYVPDYLKQSNTKLTQRKMNALIKCCTHLSKLRIDKFFRVDSNYSEYDNYKIYHNGNRLMNMYKNKQINVNKDEMDSEEEEEEEEERELYYLESDSGWNDTDDSTMLAHCEESDEDNNDCEDLFSVEKNQEAVMEFKQLMILLDDVYDAKTQKKMFYDKLSAVFFDMNKSVITIDTSGNYVVIKSKAIDCAYCL